MSQFSYSRPQLAASVCDSLEGKGLRDARSGLFLAAPRRVGKSTFLREDVLPEAAKRGWLAIYVDLWKDRRAEPGALIGDAVKSALAAHEGAITRAARASKLDKVSIAGTFTLDFSRPGLPPNVSLADALAALSALAKKPLLLIVDEAQHALSTDAGINAMFALKAARDQLNTRAGKPELMLVMTGSNRDKLTHLVLNKAQPFFGSSVSAFPLLDREFTDALAAWANKGLAGQNQFDPEAVDEAFRLVGSRPEMLRFIMGEAALNGEAGKLSALLREGARNWQDQVWADYASEFAALTPLQQAIMEVMVLRRKTGFSPFAEDSMAAYRRCTGEATISTASVQTAIEALRDRNLVWRESRGAYALEDEGFAEWFAATRPVAAVAAPEPAAPAKRRR